MNKTDHQAALAALDEALIDESDEGSDDDAEWTELKTELENDRLSNRSLYQ